MIIVDKITKKYGNNVVLNEVSFSIDSGEVIVLIGPSGVGKTTLLRCLNGLEIPDSGKIIINGTLLTKSTVNKIRKEVGMVFQSFNLFLHLNVLRNVSLALEIVKKKKKKDAESIALKILEKVGLKDKINYYPCQLSGGQQQRVAIARALALNPKLMLFDEPTSNLDPEMTKEVFNVIKELAKEGMTMIIASHEMGFVTDVANRVLFLEQGKIVEEALPEEIFTTTKYERIKKFLTTIHVVKQNTL